MNTRSLGLNALFVAAMLASASMAQGDAIDAAVAHAGRPAADITRDATDHPAQVLRMAGIKPGMKVADVLAGDGYYSELLSYIVGPKGHVYLINNLAFDNWSQPALKNRLSGDRFANVTQETVDLNDMKLPAASLDAHFSAISSIWSGGAEAAIRPISAASLPRMGSPSSR